jgi:hypothetical protein
VDIPEAFKKYSDDAKRIADEMTMHSVAGMSGFWACFDLQTGSPRDHTAYHTRREAVMAMRWDLDRTVYLEITPDGMTPKEAQAWLDWQRFLYSQGWRLPDPEFDYDAGKPELKSDRLAMANHLISGGKY